MNGFEYIRQNGLMKTVVRFAEKATDRVAHTYDKHWQKHKTSEEELTNQRNHPIECPLISVVIPTYNTNPVFLNELADSLLAQTHQNWEACFYDGASTRIETVEALKLLAQRDNRFHVAEGTANDGIAGNTNHAIAMASGEWIALCDHDDLLAPDALYRVAEVIANTGADMIYSDEDKITEDGRYHNSPLIKPDFCPDYLNSCNYICHLMVIKKTLLDTVGGLRSEFDGSQDHDLAIRCAEKAVRIDHIPHILYHWRTVGNSMSHQHLSKCTDASKRAVEEHMERTGREGRVVIQNGLLRPKYETPANPSMEIMVIESGDPENWYRLYKTMKKATHGDVRLTCISPWELSADEIADDGRAKWVEWASGTSMFAAINKAVAGSKAEYIVLLHGSVAMDGRAWINELLMYAQRSDVGAVTPVITDGIGHIIHGGFAVGRENAPALCCGKGRGAKGGNRIMKMVHNVSAVSVTCTMFRREVFVPFDTGYQGGLGSVDWSLKLMQNGLRHVCTPYAVGVCHDDVVNHWLLLNGPMDEHDAELIYQHWGKDIHDPCYGEGFSRKKADYSY